MINYEYKSNETHTKTLIDVYGRFLYFDECSNDFSNNFPVLVFVVLYDDEYMKFIDDGDCFTLQGEDCFRRNKDGTIIRPQIMFILGDNNERIH